VIQEGEGFPVAENKKRTIVPQRVELVPVNRTGEPIDFSDRRDIAPLTVSEMATRHVLFIGMVLVPTFIAVFYLLLISADQYTSEARFIVRSLSSGGPLSSLSSIGMGGNQSPAQAVMSSNSFSRAFDETYSVNEFIRSRDAVKKLEVNNGLRDVFSRSDADFINRFPNIYSWNTRENLFKHYLNFVNINMQSDSGISVLEVTTFRPEDSQALALALLEHAEELINKLNTRAQADSVRFTEEVVKLAEERIETLQVRLTEFRNRELVVDPGKQSESALALVTKLTGEVAAGRVQLENTMALTPNSPQIEPLRNRLRTLEEQMQKQSALIVGGDESMVYKLSKFEQISLERELAVKSLTSALLSLENARQDAQRQQLYLERVVEPNLPDQRSYPRRLLWISIVFGVSLCLFWIVREFRITVLEH
jgi:capsular polysaccharide transport system permease protein